MRMKRQLTLTTGPIDEAALLAGRRMSAGMGAVVCFAGVVRETEAGEPIHGLEYEAFQLMVERQFNLLFDELARRWPIESVRLIHRLGVVQVNDVSLWVEVVAPHRQEGFGRNPWPDRGCRAR